MKLVDKFTIWFIIITTLVLVAGGLIVFSRVQHEVDAEAIRRIKSNIDNIAIELQQGRNPKELTTEYVDISEIDRSLPEIDINIYDTMAVYRPRMRALDRKLTVESSYHIGEKHYKVSMYDFVAEPDEIADGVRKSIGWIFLILLAIVVLTNLLISKRILAPFHQSLRAIEDFSVRKEKEVNFPATRTKEFQQLNHFLREMTGRARADYRALKEFTENASHELQTPLAVIRGKLELLLETPLTEEQGGQILSALASIEKLSKINHSLMLLNKLENQEFAALQPLNFSELLKRILDDLTELIEMKSISVKKAIQPDVPVILHPVLADILITNVLSNAIKHNVNGGEMSVDLTSDALLVCNSGRGPEFPISGVFDRFRRSNTSDDSIGLGLAIVRQICEVSKLTVSFDYHDGRYFVTVAFPKA